jgi:hypothetical protein
MLSPPEGCCDLGSLKDTLCRYGVGGEYPMAAGSAAERAESGGIEKARARGREVVLTFSMQVTPYGHQERRM